ncbi:MAG: hypothetical protein K8T91_21730 [Planctomycetes bacterium]|nr:hypothetical protein [Planctomycetota bacterium]
MAYIGFSIIALPRCNLRTTTQGWIAIAICVALAVVTVLCATPADMNTWVSVFGGATWSLALMLFLRRATRFVLAVPVGLQVLLLMYCLKPRAVEVVVPLDGTSIQDTRGGRMGIRVLGFQFVTSTTNTRLLEGYLGPLEAQWEHHCPLSPYIRDGNERVDICSISRYEDLPAILDMLPDDRARRQVLTCITDSKNRLRAHQGLLLVALKTLNYPDGYDVDSWWDKHSHLFRQEYDPSAAAMTVWGWRERIQDSAPSYNGQYPVERYWDITRQCSTAKYQEQGSWGGDRDFGEAYDKLSTRIWNSPNKEDDFFDLEIHAIAWWPRKMPDSQTNR